MSRKKKTQLIEELTQTEKDQQARIEGPKKKKWSEHDIKHVSPITEPQREMAHCYYQGSNICGHGSAGSGKTMFSVALAIRDVLSKNTTLSKLIIVRSNVATRDVGYLPGTLEEKMEVYEAPYIDIFAFLFGRGTTYKDMKEAGLVQFMPTSFVRGLTWDDAIVIVDEAQNMTLHEINSIMTRLGENSRIIIVGDCVQTDLRKNKYDVSGFDKAIKIFSSMRSFSVIEFKHEDIVRSGLVKEWIVNYEGYEN